jgi:Domain of unknown function (DUF5753)
MYAQLLHLCRLAELPNVTLRVLPESAALQDWYLPETPFSIYRFADRRDPATVAVEPLAADIQLTDEAIIGAYTAAFDRLRAAARSPEASIDWLARTAQTRGAPQGPPDSTMRPPAQRRPRARSRAEPEA